jgi:ribonuclease HI
MLCRWSAKHRKKYALAHGQEIRNGTQGVSVKQRWKMPPEDVYKITVMAGAGAVDPLMNAYHAETLACIKGLEQASVLGLEHIILETDAEVVVNAVKNQLFDRSPLGMMFREIRARILYDFNECTSSHCPRACNEVAHTLAVMGLNCKSGPMMWEDHLPESVNLIMSSDLSG